MSAPIHVVLSQGSDPAAWLAAVGTIGAVLVALVGLLYQNRNARGERLHRLEVEAESSFIRKSEQARSISAHLTGGGAQPIQLNIINASGLMVTHFQGVAIADGYPGEDDQWRGSFFRSGEIIVVPPGPTSALFVTPPSPGLTFRHEIAFTDDNGTRWRKYGLSGLVQVTTDFNLLKDLDWEPS